MFLRVIIALVVLTFIPPFTVWAQTIRGWAIQGRTATMGGHTIYCTPAAVRIDTEDLSGICRAAGAVTMYNRKTKGYMNMSHSQFVTTFGFSKPIPAKRADSSTMFGCRVVRYEVPGPTRANYTDQVWSTKDFGLSPVIEADCAAILGIPNGLGVPLRVVRTYADGRKDNLVDTTTCAPAGFTSQHFQLEPGYRLVKDETELLMGSTGGSARPRSTNR